MIDITLENFQAELIEASLATPVLLDIWAPWCAPCKALGPVLEKLERDYAGRFTLAKLDSDQEPEIAGQLSQAFGVRSIPFCVMFVGGQPVDGFVGALPEAQIRDFLDKHVPPAADADEEDLPAAAEAGRDEEPGPSAEADRLSVAVAAEPGNDKLRADWVFKLIEAGRLAEARQALAPLQPKLAFDARAAALALCLDAHEAAPGADAEALAAAIAANRRDFAARHALAQVHWAAGRPTAAMDELLEILMRDKTWNGELARRSYVAILELMGKAAPAPTAAAPAAGKLEIAGRAAVSSADPVLDQYRRKLSMALF
ncbi:tetratricopeptide repeat protein [Piscinibacter sp. Jin2]|uniref:Tetratricopeptide repeat protein n=1 Tax=Aquariibacter lacus TaxID=2801332 RepID=A0A9X1BMW2_9BURK|nr:tetratricopeptide repeat protein [Piscinibacter lacus]MBL0718770.1 tetratricopeptide repeat protein [Piscinibacter lacus]